MRVVGRAPTLKKMFFVSVPCACPLGTQRHVGSPVPTGEVRRKAREKRRPSPKGRRQGRCHNPTLLRVG